MRSVRQLTPELFPSAAALLAEAFHSNPAHVYICPDPQTRFEKLEWLLGRNLRRQPELRTSFCLADGTHVIAMGFWTRSTAPRIGILRQLRAGLLAAPFRLGPGDFLRALEVAREVDLGIERAVPDRAFWTLNNMVVHKDHRGSGIGSRLLREQLSFVSETEPDHAIALSTQRPENVVFYRRLGFQSVSEHTIGTGRRAFRNWRMRYTPAAE
jgi:GNAT superfamily N-acetyltransferase